MVKGEVHNFSRGSIPRNIMSLALPMTAAQLINVLYSVVDRVYLGRLPGHLALTGLGLTIPIVSIIMGFANLCGTGGAPLCSIKRGQGDNEEAERVLGNAFTLLLIFGAAVTAVFLWFKQPLLYLFGASDATYPYADAYMTIYLLGTIFVMIGLGMNPFITAQGFGGVGMMTVGLGALVNIVLDPIFIFGMGMGVRGPGDCDRPGVLRSVGAALPYRAAGYSAAEGAEYGAVCPTGKIHRDPGPVWLLYELDQQLGPGGVQRHPSGLWRGPVRGGDDHHQLAAGGVFHAGAGPEQWRPASDGVQLRRRTVQPGPPLHPLQCGGDRGVCRRLLGRGHAVSRHADPGVQQ